MKKEENKIGALPKHEFCPAKQILTTIGDKWSILVLIQLSLVERLRFNEIQKELEGVSSKVLTQTLRSLEQYGLVERIVYPEVPPRVEYTLTELSNSLLPHILALSDWASEHMDQMMQNKMDYLTKSK